MKKEESKVIAQKLQKIPNGTLSIEPVSYTHLTLPTKA